MRAQRGAERELVREVRERARVQRGIVAEVAPSAYPRELVRLGIGPAEHTSPLEQQAGRFVGEGVGLARPSAGATTASISVPPSGAWKLAIRFKIAPPAW